MARHSLGWAVAMCVPAYHGKILRLRAVWVQSASKIAFCADAARGTAAALVAAQEHSQERPPPESASAPSLGRTRAKGKRERSGGVLSCTVNALHPPARRRSPTKARREVGEAASGLLRARGRSSVAEKLTRPSTGEVELQSGLYWQKAKQRQPSQTPVPAWTPESWSMEALCDRVRIFCAEELSGRCMALEAGSMLRLASPEWLIVATVRLFDVAGKSLREVATR